MQIRKLSEVSEKEQSEAEAAAWVGAAVMDEQREVHRNAQEIHGVRKYSEIMHRHPVGRDCNAGCEFWSPGGES